METNVILTGDNVEIMRKMEDETIDLTVTSPPYDNLRDYNGYSFDFESVAKELYRLTKSGGVVVWVVNDKTHKGSETGTSFKQALFFKEIGFNLHDTMIFHKKNPMPIMEPRYQSSFEYMFVFSKGKPKTVNLIQVPKSKKTLKRQQNKVHKTHRKSDGSFHQKRFYEKITTETTKKQNVWTYLVGFNDLSDKFAHKHPAVFPEKLASDHILSWSNPGDLVFDPFGGSGTTAKMAKLSGRNYIHIDVSDEYNEIARQRLEALL